MCECHTRNDWKTQQEHNLLEHITKWDDKRRNFVIEAYDITVERSVEPEINWGDKWRKGCGDSGH